MKHENTDDNGALHRVRLLLGENGMDALRAKNVIIFGVGGVGSWCAESLVRSGIRRLTLTDPDCVCVSNINRQLMATTSTIGRVKVDVLRERLLDIDPHADITAMRKAYTAETADDFDLNAYDYVIDAIDSLANKMLLINRACLSRATLFSSMGAALKMDPTRVSVAEFWKVRGCPLAASLRHRFKRAGVFPKCKFKCVYSEERLENQPVKSANPDAETNARPNGTLAHATAVFGLTLAGLVIQDIREKAAG